MRYKIIDINILLNLRINRIKRKKLRIIHI